MGEVLVRVDGVSKKFSKNLRYMMYYGVQDIAKSILGGLPRTHELRPGEFWSVDGVSFELRRGECLGLIGPNGAGKSTLLKMLNGIVLPDKGRIEIKGRVGALIEVGAGFHPMLTGRENIYINGAILGFSKREIDKKFDAIVEFSGLGDFIDSPVRHYSSGMYVRLGFAIAAQMEPDVMLIDEVLAVGDIGYRAKCFNAISRILKNAAVIFVSHSMPQVARICTDICVMNDGRAVYQGKDVPSGIEHYYSRFKAQKGIIAGNGMARIHNIELESNGRKGVSEVNYGEELTVHIHATVDSNIKKPVFNVSFLSRELQLVAQINSRFNGIDITNTGCPLYVTVKSPKLHLNPGIYSLSVVIVDEYQREVLTQHYAVKELTVRGDFVGYAPLQWVGEWRVREEVGF